MRSSFASSLFRSAASVALCAGLASLGGSPVFAQQMFSQQPNGQAAGAARYSLSLPQNGVIRALVIGVDAYQFVPQLKGAVADARDIEGALGRAGVKDVTVLVDGAADRAAVMKSIDQLQRRSRAGDLVVLSIAGHGVQEPEHVKGSQPDGLDDVFILPGFNPRTPAGSLQRIIGTEFNHAIKEFEAKGVRVMFVADACHGGGLAREIDPRAGELSYRQAPRYVLAVDDLKPISTTSDAFLTEIDFQRTTFLAAVDRSTKSPEVKIPGIQGYRGALSYAIARAFEGAADQDHDGQVTQNELFSYVRQVAYQLSDQRQNVVTTGSTVQDRGADVIYRAVVLLDSDDDQTARTGQAEPAAAQPPAVRPTTATLPTTTVTASARPAIRPNAVQTLPSIRVAVLGNQRDLLSKVEPREAKFDVVNVNDNPDIIWDPASLDVLMGADVIARGIDRSDLPSVIDRSAAINGFKRLAAKGPQTVRLLPDDKVHHRDSRIDVQVGSVAQRSLVMFNIAGDGTVQALYPIGSDAPFVGTDDYKFQVRVSEPYGADQVVAVTSSQRMTDLEQALKRMNQRRTAVEMFKLVERFAPPDARVGATSLYTAP